MISREDIASLATLARLKLQDEEVAALQKDISDILAYVGQVSAVAPQAGGPALPPVTNVLRQDEPRAASDLLAGTEEALRAQFPAQEGGYNVVRKIIQKDE